MSSWIGVNKFQARKYYPFIILLSMYVWDWDCPVKVMSMWSFPRATTSDFQLNPCFHHICLQFMAHIGIGLHFVTKNSAIVLEPTVSYIMFNSECNAKSLTCKFCMAQLLPPFPFKAQQFQAFQIPRNPFCPLLNYVIPWDVTYVSSASLPPARLQFSVDRDLYPDCQPEFHPPHR